MSTCTPLSFSFKHFKTASPELLNPSASSSESVHFAPSRRNFLVEQSWIRIRLCIGMFSLGRIDIFLGWSTGPRLLGSLHEEHHCDDTGVTPIRTATET